MRIQLGRCMDFKAFKIFGYEIKQSQVLNNYAVNSGINEFIQQAYKGRNFTAHDNDVKGNKYFAIILMRKI